jgi:hypothetical protein
MKNLMLTHVKRNGCGSTYMVVRLSSKKAKIMLLLIFFYNLQTQSGLFWCLCNIAVAILVVDVVDVGMNVELQY